LLDHISQLSTYLITGLAIIHLLAFFVLADWARRERRSLAQTLNRFTEGLPNRSQLDWGTHLADQIDGFLADIDDVLAEPQGSANRGLLRQRMQIIDERRDYLQSSRFETAWNVARTMIEAYPLAGVLGTICAIGAALAGPDGGAVSTIVGRFGDAIWSTFSGLSAAIILMLIHSYWETSFARLSESRGHVRDTVNKAKRELAQRSDSA
jgi:biopolymer transport protein ExbB/TolQ